jgi:hypothetical protein
MKSGLRRAAALVIAASVGLIIVEIGLRLLGVSYPSFYRADPTRGFSLRPHASGLYTAEGRAWLQINSEGLRDRERPRTKPVGSFRIALLGDSYTEARQVPLEATFGAVIEERLGVCGSLRNRPVEAINFGVSGYGTTQELLTLEHHALDYQPDLVVLAFVPGNDLRDNSRQLSPTSNRPFHVVQSGELTLDTSFLESTAYKRRVSGAWSLGFALIDRLRVLQVVNATKNAWAASRQVVAMDATAGQNNELGLDHFVYREPADASQAEAWEVTEAVLRRVRDQVRARGAELLLVTVTSGAQVHPDVETRRALAETLAVDDLLYAERRLSQFAAAEGIEILTLAEPMAGEATARGEFFHGFDGSLGAGHWNVAGHRVAGQAMADRICAGLAGASGASRAEASRR